QPDRRPRRDLEGDPAQLAELAVAVRERGSGRQEPADLCVPGRGAAGTGDGEHLGCDLVAEPRAIGRPARLVGIRHRDAVSMLSQDRRQPQSWNRYTYAMGNPMLRVDRNGKWSTKIHNEIIDRAFPDLSVDHRLILKRSSARMDSPLRGGQNASRSY